MGCGVEMFCMGVSASETHSQKNTGMSVADATARIIAMAETDGCRGKAGAIVGAVGVWLRL